MLLKDYILSQKKLVAQELLLMEEASTPEKIEYYALRAAQRARYVDSLKKGSNILKLFLHPELDIKQKNKNKSDND